MPRSAEIRFRLNGRPVDAAVAVRRHLADLLREGFELTGTHLGCEHGVCGACTVLLDGAPVRGCLVLAAQVDGREVETIEGLAARGELDALQEAFVRHNAAQCGYCTPGMLLTARALLQRPGPHSRRDIREFVSGNFCRCTGYQAIVDAIEAAASAAPATAPR